MASRRSARPIMPAQVAGVGAGIAPSPWRRGRAGRRAPRATGRRRRGSPCPRRGVYPADRAQRAPKRRLSPARSSAPKLVARAARRSASTTRLGLLARERPIGRAEVDARTRGSSSRRAAGRPGRRRTAGTRRGGRPPPPRARPARLPPATSSATTNARSRRTGGNRGTSGTHERRSRRPPGAPDLELGDGHPARRAREPRATRGWSSPTTPARSPSTSTRGASRVERAGRADRRATNRRTPELVHQRLERRPWRRARRTGGPSAAQPSPAGPASANADLRPLLDRVADAGTRCRSRRGRPLARRGPGCARPRAAARA